MMGRCQIYKTGMFGLAMLVLHGHQISGFQFSGRTANTKIATPRCRFMPVTTPPNGLPRVFEDSRRWKQWNKCMGQRTNFGRSSSSSLVIRNMFGPESDDSQPIDKFRDLITENPMRSILFSILMTACGAALGPFLDSYHSAFGVLQYDQPITLALWGSESNPALITSWWVPELFGLAGFIIGWLYILLDDLLVTPESSQKPSPPKILVGISFFTVQYWLSGVMTVSQVDRQLILNIMSTLAAMGFITLDATVAGILTSAATALGGPLIEVGLLSASLSGVLSEGYHYTDLGETGFFPLWILPVYFLGGPAVGNLARGFWNWLPLMQQQQQPCTICNDTRRVSCPNCDGIGTYVAMGGRSVTCTSCNGRGYVICRECFDRYDDDPYDIENIREIMRGMPD